MSKLQKYFVIFAICFRNSLTRDLSFRLNFFIGILGSFCFVGLNFFLIYFLMQKVSIGHWNQKQMWILLGTFFILYYSVFFLFWRGLLGIIRNIRSGTFDYFLVKPVDSQFLVSISGGGIHNFLATLFGIVVVLYGVFSLSLSLSFSKLFFYIVSLTLSVVDFYSFVFFLILLNFKYGYLEEVLHFAFKSQEISRYPIAAFSNLPLYIIVFVLPFSALTTIPSEILIATSFPVLSTFIFSILSLIFIFFVRICWFRAIKDYSSSN